MPPKYPFAALLVIALAPVCYAQFSPGDPSGQTSLYPADAQSFAFVSVSDKENTARVGVLSEDRGQCLESASVRRLGVEFNGKATNGFAELFKDGSASPEASLLVSLACQPRLHGSEEEARKGHDHFIRDRWYGVQLGYKRGEYQLFARERALEGQLFKDEFDGVEGRVFYNALLRGNWLAGASLGLLRANNYDDLKKVTVVDEQTVAGDDSDERFVRKETEAREGDYKEFTEHRLAIDLLWAPDQLGNRIGVDLFLRGSYSEQNDAQWEPGMGLFLLQRGAPSRILGGISVIRDEDTDSLVLGIVAGVRFLKGLE